MYVHMNPVLLLVSLVLWTHAAEFHYEYPEQWQAWKSVHGKNYTSQTEELDRHLVWLSNKKYIESHNVYEDYFGFGLAMNSFGDLVQHNDYSMICHVGL